MKESRTYWCSYELETSDSEDYVSAWREHRTQVPFEQANIVSSLLENGLHAPALDIDHEARLENGRLDVIMKGVSPDFIDRNAMQLLNANFASSISITKIDNKGAHLVSIDLAHSARLVPSKTEGHYHLYVDQEMNWDDYSDTLMYLSFIGVIEEKFYFAALGRQMTFLRKLNSNSSA